MVNNVFEDFVGCDWLHFKITVKLFFAGTLAKCSRHFVVKADGESPSSYITYFVYMKDL